MFLRIQSSDTPKVVPQLVFSQGTSFITLMVVVLALIWRVWIRMSWRPSWINKTSTELMQSTFSSVERTVQDVDGVRHLINWCSSQGTGPSKVFMHSCIHAVEPWSLTHILFLPGLYISYLPSTNTALHSAIASSPPLLAHAASLHFSQRSPSACYNNSNDIFFIRSRPRHNLEALGPQLHLAPLNPHHQRSLEPISRTTAAKRHLILAPHLSCSSRLVNSCSLMCTSVVVSEPDIAYCSLWSVHTIDTTAVSRLPSLCNGLF